MKNRSFALLLAAGFFHVPSFAQPAETWQVPGNEHNQPDLQGV
jgi:hypothetical protein